jgi:Pyruvate/2-oxoacid:ferredoxin oxidoreductase delta subunit
MAAEFAVTIDRGRCFNCGVCMDVCPIRSLDMTRPTVPGPEATSDRTPQDPPPSAWLMAAPVQVDHCNGCTICVRECPVQAISLEATPARPALAPRQGPLLVEPHGPGRGWQPLSAYTRAAMKVQEPREPHDPWGVSPRWRLAKRVAPWQVWRTWSQSRARTDTEPKSR